MENIYDLISDPSRIVLGDNIESKYLSDVLGRKKGRASALVFPVTTEEVSRVLSFAHENSIPVTSRGAGTNLVGSTIPKEGAIILDFSKMDRVLEIDRKNFTALVQPGLILEDFQNQVESLGLFYPPDPGERRASIGGNIATNAGGMRAVKYGVTRNYVMGLEVVTAEGKVLTLGSKNRKDTTGLDLKDLIIGSEGTLAVITKCLLRLIAKPEKSLSTLVCFDSLESGIEAVPEIFSANINPTAIEFIEDKVVKLGENFLNIPFPATSAAYLLLTFDGSQLEINSSVEKLRHILQDKCEQIISLEDPQVAQNVWRIRGCLVKAVEAVSEQEALDIVVPISKIADFVTFANQLEQTSKMGMISFGHAGDGNVHLCLIRGNRNEQDWETDLNANLEKLYEYAQKIGGLISGEHGLGVSKRDFFFARTAKENVELMNAVKLAFDPKKILNSNLSYVM